LNLQRRPGGLLIANLQLIRDDGGERRLAQSWWSKEQHMVQRLATAFCGFECDGELLLGLRLPDELRQPGWSQLQLERRVLIGFSAETSRSASAEALRFRLIFGLFPGMSTDGDGKAKSYPTQISGHR